MRALMAALIAALALTGCDATAPGRSPVPPVRPPDAGPSAESQALARQYQAVQTDLLSRGLLRTDGGGPDTVFSADDLTRNFETIVFYDEYTGGIGTRRGASGHLRRWAAPVKVDVEFGASVPADQRRKDAAYVGRFASRLARITGHPVARSQTGTNFHVLVMGEDDKAQLSRRIKELAPSISDETLAFLTNMPLTIECSVLAFSASDAPYAYTRAIALIRAELPTLLRQSCVHEEIAQGLGPANDSPEARPSIFNDDDEFALLTSHDEKLLKMLYDPRLTPGMSAGEARPIVRALAAEAMGQDL